MKPSLPVPPCTITTTIDLSSGGVAVTWDATDACVMRHAVESVLEGGRPEVAAVLHYLADVFDGTTHGRRERAAALLAAAERAA
jgi:hypothetical protein